MRLSFHDYSLRLRNRAVLDRVNLDIGGPGMTAVLGPSGVGKSTLLRVATRLLEIEVETRWQHDGDVRVDGQSIFAKGVDPDLLRRKLALLTQTPVMFRGSVRDNMLLGLRHASSVPRSQWLSRVDTALEQVGLRAELPALGIAARSLSGGQAQRLALARALACQPDALLLDEPTSALDPQAAQRIVDLLVELARTRLVLVVTHDLRLARAADRVAFLARGSAGAHVLAQGTPADLDDPASGVPMAFRGAGLANALGQSQTAG